MTNLIKFITILVGLYLLPMNNLAYASEDKANTINSNKLTMDLKQAGEACDEAGLNRFIDRFHCTLMNAQGSIVSQFTGSTKTVIYNFFYIFLAFVLFQFLKNIYDCKGDFDSVMPLTIKLFRNSVLVMIISFPLYVGINVDIIWSGHRAISEGASSILAGFSEDKRNEQGIEDVANRLLTQAFSISSPAMGNFDCDLSNTEAIFKKVEINKLSAGKTEVVNENAGIPTISHIGCFVEAYAEGDKEARTSLLNSFYNGSVQEFSKAAIGGYSVQNALDDLQKSQNLSLAKKLVLEDFLQYMKKAAEISKEYDSLEIGFTDALTGKAFSQLFDKIKLDAVRFFTFKFGFHTFGIVYVVEICAQIFLFIVSLATVVALFLPFASNFILPAILAPISVIFFKVIFIALVLNKENELIKALKQYVLPWALLPTVFTFLSLFIIPFVDILTRVLTFGDVHANSSTLMSFGRLPLIITLTVITGATGVFAFKMLNKALSITQSLLDLSLQPIMTLGTEFSEAIMKGVGTAVAVSGGVLGAIPLIGGFVGMGFSKMGMGLSSFLQARGFNKASNLVGGASSKLASGSEKASNFSQRMNSSLTPLSTYVASRINPKMAGTYAKLAQGASAVTSSGASSFSRFSNRMSGKSRISEVDNTPESYSSLDLATVSGYGKSSLTTGGGGAVSTPIAMDQSHLSLVKDSNKPTSKNIMAAEQNLEAKKADAIDQYLAQQKEINEDLDGAQALGNENDIERLSRKKSYFSADINNIDDLRNHVSSLKTRQKEGDNSEELSNAIDILEGNTHLGKGLKAVDSAKQRVDRLSNEKKAQDSSMIEMIRSGVSLAIKENAEIFAKGGGNASATGAISDVGAGGKGKKAANGSVSGQGEELTRMTLKEARQKAYENIPEDMAGATKEEKEAFVAKESQRLLEENKVEMDKVEAVKAAEASMSADLKEYGSEEEKTAYISKIAGKELAKKAKEREEYAKKEANYKAKAEEAFAQSGKSEEQKDAFMDKYITAAKEDDQAQEALRAQREAKMEQDHMTAKEAFKQLGKFGFETFTNAMDDSWGEVSKAAGMNMDAPLLNRSEVLKDFDKKRLEGLKENDKMQEEYRAVEDRAIETKKALDDARGSSSKSKSNGQMINKNVTERVNNKETFKVKDENVGNTNVVSDNEKMNDRDDLASSDQSLDYSFKDIDTFMFDIEEGNVKDDQVLKVINDNILTSSDIMNGDIDSVKISIEESLNLSADTKEKALNLLNNERKK